MTFYKLLFEVCIQALTEDKDVWVRVRLDVPFAPRVGDKLRIYNPVAREEKEIELVNVHWSFKEGCFIEEQSDTRFIDAHREQRPPNMEEVTQDYMYWGFNVFDPE